MQIMTHKKPPVLGFQIASPPSQGWSRAESLKFSKREPLYDKLAARVQLTDQDYALIKKAVSQEGFTSDGNYDDWLDEGK